jgi:hypothetical protein
VDRSRESTSRKGQAIQESHDREADNDNPARPATPTLTGDSAPPDPADRIVYHAADQVQCDLWFPEPKIGVGDGAVAMLPVLVMVASFSKFITAVMIPSRTTADLLAGMWALLAGQLGAVPRRLIWDNEAGVGRRNHLAAGVGEFSGVLATRIHQLKAYDPESKGGVNGPTSTSRPPSCPGGTSPPRPSSTTRSVPGRPVPTPARSER